MKPRVVPFGEGALLVELGNEFQENVVAWARAIAEYWDTTLRYGPAVPAYASVVLRFDPLRIEPTEAETAAAELLARGEFTLVASPTEPRRLVEIPTTYDGPDLAETAERSHLSVDGLVALHAKRDYTAYFLGFMPGFAYCGRLGRDRGRADRRVPVRIAWWMASHRTHRGRDVRSERRRARAHPRR